MPNLKNVSVTDLLNLRKNIEVQLQSKRYELQAMLAEIGGRSVFVFVWLTYLQGWVG